MRQTFLTVLALCMMNTLALPAARAEAILLPFYNIGAFCSTEEAPSVEKCKRREAYSFEKTRIGWGLKLPFIKWSCLQDNKTQSYVALEKCLRWRSSKKWAVPPEDVRGINLGTAQEEPPQ